MSREKWEKIEVFPARAETTPVPLVSSAAIATVNAADGRLVPLVIIDCSSRPDIDLFIRAHEYTEPGDAESIWFKPSEKDDILDLLLRFTKPSRCSVLLEFDILKYGGLIDSIVISQCLYLQCGKEGDTFASTFNRERIIVEIPSKSFRTDWDKALARVLEKDFRNRKFSKRDAKKNAEEVIRKWRVIANIRMRDG